MIFEHGKVEGSIRIDSDYELHGMITGSATVVDGGRLILNGMACKDLNIEPRGSVLLHGMVIGNVYNRGGHLEIYGMIKGSLHKEGGETIVDDNAVIQGGIV